MRELFAKIEDSFKRAMRGEEKVNNIIWLWGAISYVLAFFVADKMIKSVDLFSFDVVISSVMIIYFIWHFYVLRKCTPKKPKLTKEEKELLKEQARKERGKKFFRKLFLQEPITETDPVFVTMVIDLFFIAHFGGYIF